MSLSSNNNRKIEKAFSRFLSSTKEKSYRAVSRGTGEGYGYALDLHKTAQHNLHLTLGGDFGYMVAQDGSVRKSDVVKGKVEVYATAVKALDEHLANAPQSGVLGVVSAGMESAPFDDPWERSVLTSAFQKAKDRAIREFEK